MTTGGVDDGESLRRRLYRPGAGDADVDAYRTAVAVAPEPLPEPAPAPPARGRVRIVVVVVGVIALLIGAVLVPRIARGPVGAHPAPLPTRSIDPATAARFVAALDAGQDAGLGAWFDPQAPLVEEHGTGDRSVALPASGSASGGRMVVLLVLAADGTAGWETDRFVITDQHAIVLQQEAGATGGLRAGVPTVARIAYPADHRPLRLLVHAGAGVRWGVAAILTG